MFWRSFLPTIDYGQSECQFSRLFPYQGEPCTARLRVGASARYENTCHNCDSTNTRTIRQDFQSC